jgi:hypothetical protein
MDNVTQQNAALVEEASAASKSMEQQSSTLVGQIGYFRTGDTHVIAAPPPAASRPAPRAAAQVRSLPARGKTRKPASAAAAPAPARAPAPLARASGDDSSWQEF